jgi:hypothetical protein
MKRRTREKLAMGSRTVVFLRENPDGSDGGKAAVLRLEALNKEGMDEGIAETRGHFEFHSASALKRHCRRTLRRTLLPHVARAAAIADAEVPGIAMQFVVPRNAQSDSALLTIARTFNTEAAANKDVLVKYGLSDTVLSALDATVKEFADAIETSAVSRQAHVGASGRLDAIAAEIVKVVKVLDSLNRLRFAGDARLLAEWRSASNVVTVSPRSAPEPAAGSADATAAPPAETRPAA